MFFSSFQFIIVDNCSTTWVTIFYVGKSETKSKLPSRARFEVAILIVSCHNKTLFTWYWLRISSPSNYVGLDNPPIPCALMCTFTRKIFHDTRTQVFFLIIL